MSENAPVLFISHGAGPCFFMDGRGSIFEDIDQNSSATTWYKNVATEYKITQPKAIVIVSAHWESEDSHVVEINTAQNHTLMFDYFGFPQETYQLQYPAKGDLNLASQIKELLDHANFKTKCVSDRGLDHGVFIPFKLMYPEANIPIVQISLLSSLDLNKHYQMGQVLSSLRQQGVMIVGSGQVTHGRCGVTQVKAFTQWVTDVLTNDKYSVDERKHKMLNFTKEHADARANHPRIEHFVPLLFALGAAQAQPAQHISDIYGMRGAMSLACYQFVN